MVGRQHPSLSLVRQCILLEVSRSSPYYRPRAASTEGLSLIGRLTGSTWRRPSTGRGG